MSARTAAKAYYTSLPSIDNHVDISAYNADNGTWYQITGVK